MLTMVVLNANVVTAIVEFPVAKEDWIGWNILRNQTTRSISTEIFPYTTSPGAIALISCWAEVAVRH